jgi:septum formation protein
LILNKLLPPLILASASPRRQRLFSLLGLPFTVAVSDVDETLPPDTSPEEIVRDLALAKAQAIAARQPNSLIVAADTVVALDDRILGKPRDAEEAVAMLLALRGRWHRVWTGLAVVGAGNEPPLAVTVFTDVLMRDYSGAEIADYVATGDPLDKAAAYAIQYADFHPVARIAGCHANVMGLPLCYLHPLLIQLQVTAPVLPAIACPAHLGIVCPLGPYH